MATVERVLVGHVPVDSGQLMLTDPCYITSGFDDEFTETTFPHDDYPLTYNGASHATLSEGGYGELDGLAIAFSSGHGDGCYPVYLTIVTDDDGLRTIAKMEVEMASVEV